MPPPSPTAQSDALAVLSRFQVDGQTLRVGGNWQELLRLLGHEGEGTVTLVLDGERPLAVDTTLAEVKLTRAAARALQQLGPWTAIRPARDGSVELHLERAVPEQLPADLNAYLPLLQQLAAGAPPGPEVARLVDEAIDVWKRPGFDTFVSLPRLRFQPFPYQLQAAASVLRRMRGRAILADEVGLGKTIEAGLVLSELSLRSQAEHVLILVPTGLVEQWTEELDRKFGLPYLAYGSAAWQQTERALQAPILIVPLAAARRAPLRDALAGVSWDLVIVDEAHRLKNPQTASARLVKALRTRRMLLLTATPVENRLEDLFHLVTLVRPGQLGTLQQFRTRYGPTPSGEAARDVAGLQAQMRQVMVRHRRSEVALMLPRRLAETLRIAPQPEEAAVYALVSERVRAQAQDASHTQVFALRSVQRLAGSSWRALAPTLQKMGWPDLAQRAASMAVTSKAQTLRELLRRHHARGEKVVVFTAFRETLSYLVELAAADDLPAAVYHGSLSRREKDAAIAAFRSELPVLLTTEAAGEGRNLQFCHVMINYDLPWNPMQIEQRLGRIHRIGQEHDVLLTNLVTRDTIEDHILRVLESKVNLFELVIGELDMILGRVDDDFDFESFVFQAYVSSRSDHEFATRLDDLGEQLTRARREYLGDRERVDQLVPAPAEESA
jgi:SNF2 family DNA or RNA helicase